MRFDVLGPLRAAGARGPVVVPRGRSAAALCWLIASANQPVPVEALVPVLWTKPPPTALAKARLIARSLGPVLDPGTLEVGAAIRLIVSDDAVDAWRFERLIREARSHLAAGDRARGQANLRDALALWRGDPYPELERALPALGLIDHLADLRLSAAEDLNALALAEPVDYPLVAELRSQVVLHPERPRLRRQLALALYRTDRQVEALTVLRELRRDQGDEDGRAAALESAMLQHAPELARGELPVG